MLSRQLQKCLCKKQINPFSIVSATRGKNVLMLRYHDKQLEPYYYPTINGNFAKKDMKVLREDIINYSSQKQLDADIEFLKIFNPLIS